MIKVKIKTYCFHCGKELKQEEIYTSASGIRKNIHKECKKERQRLTHYFKKQKLMEIMSDPIIKNRIKEIDESLLNKQNEMGEFKNEEN